MLIRPAHAPGRPDDYCAIAVMAKASAPGRTKTRLVPPLTHEQAAAFNTAFLADIAENLMAASATERIAGYMAFGPKGAAPFFEQLMPPEIGLIETWLPDFGDCLFHALTTMLGMGYGSAVVLNSDSPTLPTEFLVWTAMALRRPGDRIVLGPSTDGGYYLLGLKERHRRLFDDITWSTEVVAAQTLERARELGLEIVMLPEWYDIDDGDALAVLADEVLLGKGFSHLSRSRPAPHSAAALRELGLADNAPAAVTRACQTVFSA
ncbi:MAG TPA: TIGR04282 family arsenosugar biosynthesis glycosyltransferase [Stellaceae bacterium]|jgi:rSAM/selenodomain-associated transferase 1|nr:TIGR04282 family arsenosugar biosynthesis glycosyltransferase [Stellaceae bacterium]